MFEGRRIISEIGVKIGAMHNDAIKALRDVSVSQLETAVADALEKLTGEKCTVSIGRLEFVKSQQISWIPPHAANLDLRIGAVMDDELLPAAPPASVAVTQA